MFNFDYVYGFHMKYLGFLGVVLFLIKVSSSPVVIQVTPERVEIHYYTDDFARNVSMVVGRASRRSPYVLNCTGYFCHATGDNVTANVSLLEFRSNEYRHSIVELSFQVCQYMKSGIWHEELLRTLIPQGCPIKRGITELKNVFKDSIVSPVKWPFGKSCLDITFFRPKPFQKLFNAKIYVNFKQLTRDNVARRQQKTKG